MIKRPPLLRTITADFLSRHTKFFKAIGRIETFLLDDLVQDQKVIAPIYINGMARSGSTLLLEILADHSDVATHKYSDFPFITTPYWWHYTQNFIPSFSKKPKERAHGDGLYITHRSPEAMEEMLWQAFSEHNTEFERFYNDTIVKLLLCRKKGRYAAKGNYNTSRMQQIQGMFPDCRFIIPVRNPIDHVASLMRQHQHFMQLNRPYNLLKKYMTAVGHFEFGPGRRPYEIGGMAAEIEEAWRNGDEVTGYALSWKAVYGYIWNLLSDNKQLASSSLIVSLEEICQNPEPQITAILEHCRLTHDRKLVDKFTKIINSRTKEYTPLSQEDKDKIIAITGDLAEKIT